MSRRLRIIAGAGSGHPLPYPPATKVRPGLSGEHPAKTGPTAEVSSAEARGYARGIEEGRGHAEASISDAVERTAMMLAEMTEELDRLLAAIELQAVHASLKVGLEVARRILGREVASDPEVVERSVAAAIAQLPGAVEVEIHVDPLDLERISQGDALRGMRSRGRIRFIADPSVGRGGCVVRSEAGMVDARLESQLRAAAECLFDLDAETSGRSEDE